MPSKYAKDEAFGDMAVIICGFVAVCLVLTVVVACVVAPLSGNWSPDIAFGIMFAVTGICYGIYRLCLRRYE